MDKVCCQRTKCYTRHKDCQVSQLKKIILTDFNSSLILKKSSGPKITSNYRVNYKVKPQHKLTFYCPVKELLQLTNTYLVVWEANYVTENNFNRAIEFLRLLNQESILFEGMIISFILLTKWTENVVKNIIFIVFVKLDHAY